MIRIDYKGRRGNNLFQYMTAKILADIYKQNIENTLNTIIIKPPNLYDDNHSKCFFGLRIHEDNLIDVITNPKINCYHLFIDTFCQSPFIANLFNENRQHLCEIQNRDNNDVFVHVRLGDILGANTHCCADYYESILKSINFENGYIASDSPNHSIVTSLANTYNLKIFNDSPENTIVFGSTCKHKILSMGTFSWWIGFLGRQDSVFFPDYESMYKWGVKDKWIPNIYVDQNWNFI